MHAARVTPPPASKPSRNALSFYLDRGYIHAGEQLPDTSWPLSKSLAEV